MPATSAAGGSPSRVAGAAVLSLPAAIMPVLLTDEQGAALYGVGMRTFLEFQNQPWFPTPRLLGPRIKRHVYAELVAAVDRMPRQEVRQEPTQLALAKARLRGRPA